MHILIAIAFLQTVKYLQIQACKGNMYVLGETL